MHCTYTQRSEARMVAEYLRLILWVMLFCTLMIQYIDRLPKRPDMFDFIQKLKLSLIYWMMIPTLLMLAINVVFTSGIIRPIFTLLGG